MAHWFCPLWAGSNFLRNQGVRPGIRPNKSHGPLAPDSTLQSQLHRAVRQSATMWHQAATVDVHFYTEAQLLFNLYGISLWTVSPLN